MSTNGSNVDSEEITLLTGEENRFSDVTVNEKLLAKTPAAFERQLEQSLDAWRKAKHRGIWLSIPHDQTELIPVAQKLGFVLHHAKPELVMLTHWLAENEPNQLPSYAMSTIGVGGLVVNKNREVLLIKERYAYVDNYFKLPGGALDMGESIESGVEREVFEETGIRAHFRGILSFTYELDFRFGHGDVYFACLMALDETLDEQIVNFDPHEIAVCQWMSLDKWASSPELHPIPIMLHFARMAIDVLDGREKLFEGEQFNQQPWNFISYRKIK